MKLTNKPSWEYPDPNVSYSLDQSRVPRVRPVKVEFDPISSAVAVALYGLEGDWSRINPTPLDDIWTTSYHQAKDLIHHATLFVRIYNEQRRQRIYPSTGEEAARYMANVLGMKDNGVGGYEFVWEGFRHQVRAWRNWLYFNSWEEK